MHTDRTYLYFVAPAIYISSPGPIFFSQVRIGQNGKPFKMYKFRSMYMDAEERKAELMAQNKMSDSRMFKLDFAPPCHRKQDPARWQTQNRRRRIHPKNISGRIPPVLERPERSRRYNRANQEKV